ncbi:MAG: hypothetical protein ABJB86_24015 [Bacteroidota bacterium]
MRFSKSTFILLLAVIFVLPFFIHRLIWLYNAVPSTGTMCFMGKSLNGQFSSEYPVIRFSSNGHDTVFFNGREGMEFTRAAVVPVLFQKKNPADARINFFSAIWMDTFINAAIPLVILIIVFLHPDLIPRRSIIIIGKKPLIQFADRAKK